MKIIVPDTKNYHVLTNNHHNLYLKESMILIIIEKLSCSLLQSAGKKLINKVISVLMLHPKLMLFKVVTK